MKAPKRQSWTMESVLDATRQRIEQYDTDYEMWLQYRRGKPSAERLDDDLQDLQDIYEDLGGEAGEATWRETGTSALVVRL